MVMEDLNRAEIEWEPVTPVVWVHVGGPHLGRLWGCSDRFGSRA